MFRWLFVVVLVVRPQCPPSVLPPLSLSKTALVKFKHPTVEAAIFYSINILSQCIMLCFKSGGRCSIKTKLSFENSFFPFQSSSENNLRRYMKTCSICKQREKKTQCLMLISTALSSFDAYFVNLFRCKNGRRCDHFGLWNHLAPRNRPVRYIDIGHF